MASFQERTESGACVIGAIVASVSTGFGTDSYREGLPLTRSLRPVPATEAPTPHPSRRNLTPYTAEPYSPNERSISHRGPAVQSAQANESGRFAESPSASVRSTEAEECSVRLQAVKRRAGQHYSVLARESADEELRNIGVVKAPNAAMALVCAIMNYRERKWLDLTVVAQTPYSSEAPQRVESTDDD